MAYDKFLADRVRQLLKQAHAPFVDKPMMGGLCFMVDGKMCVGISGDRLMVRLDPAVYEESLKLPGCQPMDFTGKPLRGFVFVKPDGILTDAQLQPWLDKALEFNPRAKAAKPKRQPMGQTPGSSRRPRKS